MQPSTSSPLRLSALAFGILAAFSAQAQQSGNDDAATVAIKGQRASLRNAIAAQEKADNIISVVSSDDIGGLPDKNAAEALARLPGVSVQRDQGEGRYISVRGLGPDLNAVTINGALVPSPEAGRRAVALDILPAGLIRTLEVSKTLLPEMDANSLGATVEVKSLSAFDLPGRLLSANIGASHDEKTGKTSPNGGVLWAQRLLDGKLGVAVGASAEKRSFGSDDVETGGAWNNGRLSTLELRDYLPVRKRNALAVNLDYRPQADNSWFLRSFLSEFSDNEVRDRLTISNIAGGNLAEGETAGARAERRIRQRKYTQQVGSLVLGTQQKSGDWTLDVKGGTSRATEDTPEALNDGRFRSTSNIPGISFSGTEQPLLSGPASLYDPASYTLNAITLQKRYSKDNEHHARIDLARKFDLATLKFGAKISRRDKNNDTDQWAYNSSKASSGNYWGAGSTAMSDFVQNRNLDYDLGRIGLALDPALIRARVAGLDRDKARLATESAINDYRMQEDINSLYVQNSYDFDSWHILGGVRAERTRFQAAGAQVDSAGAATPLTRERSYTNWLPNLQARYDLDHKTSVRAAWTQAVVRANFSQLAPGVNLASNTEAVIGNPDLQPLKANNLDLGIERVLGNDGVMSAYGYYKDIKNFTYTTNLAGTGAWTGYSTATSYANGDTAKVKGIELAYMQPLRMLPAPFNQLLIGVNGTLSTSSAQVGRFDKAAGRQLNRAIRLPGQSNQVMNLMLGYETGPVSTRLALNYKSPYLLEMGSDILQQSQDRIVDSQKQLDFSISYQLSKQFQLTFEAANLNNEKYYVYQGTKAYNVQNEQYGRTYKLSLKASAF
ncbi:TonB-dependent receptor [Janthinobacterium sp. Mn2066]|uniref:TonB-dependent receptor n=1 Tax=Janthinobacterium sp. Mn2066 TaxID=3395264 RepID=UPI003BCB882F